MFVFLISKYICDPAPGGVVEGGGPEGVSPPGTATVSKHETKSVAQHQGAWSRGGGPGGVSSPPRLRCPSTRQGTVTKHDIGYCVNCVQARDMYCD